MWQALFESLADQPFVVIAVALDQPEAARAWIEAASPTYPCLIDRDHHVADLFNLVNVPQAVWIDAASCETPRRLRLRWHALLQPVRHLGGQ